MAVLSRGRLSPFMLVFGAVAFLGAIASMTPLADAEIDVSAEDFSCSVRGVEGGIEIAWPEIRGVESVTYKLDVPGDGSQYASAIESPVVIPMPDEIRVTVAMSPIFDGGKEQARRPCGMARVVAGTGVTDMRCTLSTSDTGRSTVTWDDVPGVASYGLKIDVAGDESSTYRRTTSSRTYVETAPGQEVTIGVAPVFADGSTRARVPCVDESA